MLCTSLCSIGGRLMRLTSPCTRIIGGRPDDKCRSDALFFTTKASNSVRSITILPVRLAKGFFFAGSTHYGWNRGQPASHTNAHRRRARGDIVGSVERPERGAHPRGGRGRSKSLRRELRAGGRAKNGSVAPARMASDRAAPEQQDAPRRGALRLGADARE